MNAGYDMAVAEVATTASGSGVNWAFLGVIAGCIVLGVVIGIVIGRMAMKKRDF